MPTVLLVRHAQASFGSDHYDVLSPRGLEQVAALAGELRRRRTRIARVVSGTLVRQRDTAAGVADGTGVPVEVDARWDEYRADDILAHHSATGVRLEPSPGAAVPSPAEFQAGLDDALLAWAGVAAADDPATESWPAFGARVGAALTDVAASLGRGETAVVCTSGGALAAACTRLLGGGPSLFVALNRVAVNAGITKVISGARGTRLLAFNDHAHLEGQADGFVTFR